MLRVLPPPVREVYIVAIGESLRHDNLSLNGVYPRPTTPQLESMDNLILFDNYYSQACLTMYSVPMLITRATPQNYDLNFMERSIIEPFRECGFKTFTIVSNTNLLSSETYLSDGVDSLIVVPNIVRNGEIVSGDKTMIHIVDSLVQQHDKLFIMMQFLGNQVSIPTMSRSMMSIAPTQTHVRPKSVPRVIVCTSMRMTIVFSIPTISCHLSYGK